MVFKMSKPTDTADQATAKSEDTTGASSNNLAVPDIERETEKQTPASAADSRTTSSSESKRKAETTASDEAKALEKMDDEVEYPTGTKLAFITFALCISVFLMALVCLPSYQVGDKRLLTSLRLRTTQ
jgi:hypothetical protein